MTTALAPRLHSLASKTVAPQPMSVSGKSAMEYRAKRLKFQVKNPADTVGKVATFLRARHPRKTADEVSADTGISAKTISTWLAGTSCPGGCAMLCLAWTYGPDFLAAVMPNRPQWLSDAALAEKQRRLDAEIAALEAQREALR